MKIFIIIIAIIFGVKLNAQSLLVYLTNGNIEEYPLTEVAKITFSETEMFIHKTDNSIIGNSIDVISKYNYNISTEIKPININNSLGLKVYPNPSKNDLNIYYNLMTKSDVSIVLFDNKGLCVKSIKHNEQEKGSHYFLLNNNLNTGIYFLKIRTNNLTETRKIIIKN